jgi:hypothetical protein
MNFFNVLKVEISFCTIINMMIIFHSIFKMLKKPILKVKLSKFFKNASTYTRCPILQNGLHVDEILIFQKFQVNEALKGIYELSNYACYNYNISKL